MSHKNHLMKTNPIWLLIRAPKQINQRLYLMAAYFIKTHFFIIFTWYLYYFTFAKNVILSNAFDKISCFYRFMFTVQKFSHTVRWLGHGRSIKNKCYSGEMGALNNGRIGWGKGPPLNECQHNTSLTCEIWHFLCTNVFKNITIC